MKNAGSIMAAADMSACAVMAEKRAAMLCVQLGIERLDIINIQDVSVINMLTSMMKSSSDSVRQTVWEGVAKELAVSAAGLEKQYGIKCEQLVRFGKAFHEILTAVEERRPALLAVGAHGDAPRTSRFLGSLPVRLLQASPTPILVIRKEPEDSYKKIVVAVDFSDISRYQTQQALALAAPDAEIILVHAYEVPNDGKMRYASVPQKVLQEFRSDTRIRLGAKMQNFIADLKSPLYVRSVIKQGVPHEVIRQLAETEDPDLLVMGKLGRSRFAELMLGSTSRHVIYETDCDILLVPPSAMAAARK